MSTVTNAILEGIARLEQRTDNESVETKDNFNAVIAVLRNVNDLLAEQRAENAALKAQIANSETVDPAVILAALERLDSKTDSISDLIKLPDDLAPTPPATPDPPAEEPGTVE